MSISSEDDSLTFTVIRTSDATKRELTLPLSTKLGELKTILTEEEYFGPDLSLDNQRIFHLGREWKSQGRTLSKLGFGRFNNRILHLQIRPDAKQVPQRRNHQKRSVPVAETKTNSVIELLDDSDDEVETLDNNKRSRVS
eukprot:CAMPEP_0117034644 /NCGR_PEP_ID=MMETSP0472-20121206/24652_1 /TAXON_ID=693140 ORGANISM="Tiarina fusus, Strain LIS" /NCGR_SAMPLE_ID=MMETSP0472 /ASSEMBLY_ACC=CAM_ASM_000603 /LENGTH=139 /DNA_ID=CAMNT_0004743875 /DNA_START=84 /DNA_END=503 /DNA_ORIENTATION=+